MKSGRKVVKLAGEVSPDFEEEKIHKIRTTIKKIRAIGVWTGLPAKEFFKENYKALGKIRDVQLVISKIHKGDYIVPEPFTGWLESSLHHLKVDWQKKFDPEKAKKQLKKLESHLNEKKPGSKHSLMFEKKKNEKLSSFMHARPITDDQIHTGRKTIKQIGFLNKWEKKNTDGQMKVLSDETGNFMDRISAIKLLEQYIAEEADDFNKKQANSTLADWMRNKEQEKNQLLMKIDSLPG